MQLYTRQGYSLEGLELSSNSNGIPTTGALTHTCLHSCWGTPLWIRVSHLSSYPMQLLSKKTIFYLIKISKHYFIDKRTYLRLSLSWMVLSRNQNHLHRKHCNPRSLALFRSKIHQILERNKMRSCLQLYVHGIVKCCTNCLRSRPIIYHVRQQRLSMI